ncbi:MAG: WbqC family protein [Bacteroidota bacterium]
MNLFPSSYFPSITYFQEIYLSKNPVISGNEVYVKQSFRNRCEILTGNGIQLLSVPVIKTEGSKTLTKEIRIVQNSSWRKDQWGAIKSAYQNAPYFEFFDLEIHDLLLSKHDFLIDFNCSIFNFITTIFDLSTIIVCDESLENEPSFTFLERKHNCKEYIQVFADRYPFQSNLSILDLLFCEGPLGRNYILND